MLSKYDSKISDPELQSIVNSDSSTGYLPPITNNMKPYGESIGYALDIIVVQPSSPVDGGDGSGEIGGVDHSLLNDTADEITNTSDNEPQQSSSKPEEGGGIIASSDFTVHFPDHVSLRSARNYVIQIQINGRLLDESFLSMKLPEYSKKTNDHGSTMCAFSQGSSAKPPTEVLQELVRKGLLNPGRNLIRYILIWRDIPVERNSKTVHKNGVRGVRNGDTKADDKIRTPIGFADAHIYLWSVHDTVIVSDIDGTVTKSDIRGVISTIVTKKYTHVHDGICAFFSNLVQHANDVTESVKSLADKDEDQDMLCSQSPKGGKVRILYLSSRALRLINSTRNFLNLVQQSDSGSTRRAVDSSMDDNSSLIGMPPGPIFMNKGTMATVLKMEILLKTAHEFKADVLARQVVLPFVAAGKKSVSTLFNAGFGNKHTDAMAYEMVGIDKSSIYIINPHSLLVSTRMENEDDENDEYKEDRIKSNSICRGCGVLELLDPTISLFKKKPNDGSLSPTNISVKSPPGDSSRVVSKKMTYTGYNDPILTTALYHKIQRDRVS